MFSRSFYEKQTFRIQIQNEGISMEKLNALINFKAEIDNRNMISFIKKTILIIDLLNSLHLLIDL